MFDHIQDYYQPRSVPEAIRLLRTARGRGRFVAGGTDLVVQADRSIRVLVDVTRLGLDSIRRRGSGCVIGAAATMAALEQSPQIRALAGGILSKAAATCGSVQIRHMATVGGNLANASPAADTATPLLAMDAAVVMAGSKGRRQVPLAEFFTGPGKTVLNGALLLEIVIPATPRGGRAGWSFQKLGRVESDVSIVSAAAGLGLERDRRCAWTRIALGAVAPTPLRARKTERLLVGQVLTPELIERAGETVMQEVRPITDVRASADYRREMSGVLVRRALRECAEQAGCRL